MSRIASVHRGKEAEKSNGFSNLDDSATWLERLVEAHGFLEDTYIKTLERARSVLEAQKDLQGKPTVNLEQQGIRMKTFELSRAIADRENALNTTSGLRVKNILSGLREVILSTSEELKTRGKYTVLKHRNKMETVAMERGPKLVSQELHLHGMCSMLIESIIEERKRGQLLIKEREAQAASLKDYLKEQKVLRSLEIAYIKKFSEASLEQVKKSNQKNIEELRNEEEMILRQISDDARTNEVMENYLKKEIDEKQELLKWWIIKYDLDVERKSKELKEIKEQLDKDMEWFEILKKRIVEYEKVIEDDGRTKAADQIRIEQEKLYVKKAIQIQKWWRALRVRRCLGPFKKRKQKKGKSQAADSTKKKK